MWQYLKSKEFWLTVSGLIAFGVLSFILLFYVFLPSYTMHGDSITVPDVTKMSIEDALGQLEEDGLGLELADSIYMPGVPGRSVVSQDPAALSKVKPGRKIYLTVNKMVPPMVKFPNVLYVSNYQAKLRLDSWGLSINKIKYVPNELRNVVLEARLNGKTVEEGEMLPVGTRVDLVVGKGLGNLNIGVPDLIGLSYEAAISQIHEIGLNIGSLRFKPEAEEPIGTIIQQNPIFHPRDSLRLGSSVDLFISGEEPKEALEAPLDSTEISD